MGRFRVPTLRNVALTAPYMHDGSVATLEQVIDRYARVGTRIRARIRASGRYRYRKPNAPIWPLFYGA